MEVKDREDKDIRQPDLKSMNMEELRNWVIGAGQPAFRAKQIYQWFHVKLADGTEEMTNLPKSLREKMDEYGIYGIRDRRMTAQINSCSDSMMGMS